MPDLIFAACDGTARLSLRLLPEDAGPTPAEALDVTGAYTATDQRESGAPKPVGLFLRDGIVINREYVRFDGVLVIDRLGVPQLHLRRDVTLGAVRYDLNSPARRTAFLDAASAAGADVMQSHLLIVEGAPDVAPRDGAPTFRRRILFQMANGDIGLFDSSPRALTLHDATEEVAARFRPRMALNLDMGSYNFCRRGETLCGTLGEEGMAKLSNLLRLSTAP